MAQDESLSTRYYSLSAQIKVERKDYYKILEHTNKADGEITERVLWFWQHYALTSLKERQSKVINRLLEAGPGGSEGGLTRQSGGRA